MTAPLLGTAVTEILDAVLDDGPDHFFVVNPSARAFEQLTDAAVAIEGDLPPMRVLADEDVLKDVMADFLVASRAADLLADGTLSLRTLSGDAHCSIIVSEERTVALVEVDELVGGLSTNDAEFVDVTADAVESDWESADSFSVRTPPISEVSETLESAIGDDARADFHAMLDVLDTEGDDEHEVDEVVVSLLVAAKNGVLLYDISKWGEDVGIASKATFSRTKTKLEDVGLVDTEKVPIDVGRPRLRLRLAGGLDPDDDPATVVQSAIDVLSA
ncbi:transcriptional regulator TbsP [Halanaeroarchaeum sulfurireducens]|uniref:Transcriptional regulator n=1 Tax=Halanaeroarchaeum sulfurireducens TaxID=1604004 RepID=A0A0F7PE30_9EURY|nr:DUF5821 family protein [Halanaeroarchaeum sulfurireducens]AKH97874.1 hypothetical protein HLASF_1390 [Halanaeroarchaeum sulfurireducens]ALG82268.1 hypothetical protein HLASA_1377 [Halanaeroarchaeum sulfurireducens]